MSRLVKGVSRQVIVVKAPDPRFFEQAIFILKEDAFGRGVTADDVLQEARRVADGYIRRNSRWSRLWRAYPRPRLRGRRRPGGYGMLVRGPGAVETGPPRSHLLRGGSV